MVQINLMGELLDTSVNLSFEKLKPCALTDLNLNLLTLSVLNLQWTVTCTSEKVFLGYAASKVPKRDRVRRREVLLLRSPRTQIRRVAVGVSQ